MRAIDTNVLVRLIARDDARQVAAAERFIEGGAWVSVVVLVEALWVLDSVYRLKPEPLASAVEMLMDHRELVLQDGEAVAGALVRFRKKPSLGFSDCLIVELARRAGHGPVGTFDRDLGKIEGAEWI